MSGNEVGWDYPDEDTYTYTERVLQSCGHVQEWEQFRGLSMVHDAGKPCWDCEPCPVCDLKRSACQCDPFDDLPAEEVNP